MARSELQELYERAWEEKRALDGPRREMVGHYCVFLAGKYVAEQQQAQCPCRPSRYVTRIA